MTSWNEEGRDWPNREHSQFIRASAIRWHLQVMGNGPVLLALHGTGASTHSFRDLMPVLAESVHRRCGGPPRPWLFERSGSVSVHDFRFRPGHRRACRRRTLASDGRDRSFGRRCRRLPDGAGCDDRAPADRGFECGPSAFPGTISPRLRLGGPTDRPKRDSGSGPSRPRRETFARFRGWWRTSARGSTTEGCAYISV